MTRKQIISELDEVLASLPREKAGQVMAFASMMNEMATYDEMKAFFRDHRMTLEDQSNVILCYLSGTPDHDVADELLKRYDHCLELMESIALRRRAKLKNIRKNNPIPYSAAGKTGPYTTFRLTSQAPPADDIRWTLFVGSLPSRLLPDDEREPFRSLIGLSDKPLEAPVLLSGTLQEAALLFASLCGAMTYDVPRNQEGIAAGHYVSRPFIAVPDSRGLVGLQADGARPRLGDSYCQFLADRLADPRAMRRAAATAGSRGQGTVPASAATPEAIIPRIPIADASRITDAKSALLTPSKGTSLSKIAPLLKPLIALGALTRE